MHDRIVAFSRSLRLWAALSVAATTVLASAAAASAADTPGGATSHRAHVQTTTAPMTLDCAHLSVRARHYALAHHYCSGAAGPDNVVYGNCGSSQIFVFNNGDSTAQFDWGFDSSEGAVIGHSLTISYQIGGGGASFEDFNAGPWSSSYRNSENRYTGTGPISTALDGTILLWWGGTCTIAHPTDTDYIT